MREVLFCEPESRATKDRYHFPADAAGDGGLLQGPPLLLSPKPAGVKGEGEREVNAVKLLRAYGGCLGARRRRRAWKTAKSPVELLNER